jgi:hypothetical protein
MTTPTTPADTAGATLSPAMLTAIIWLAVVLITGIPALEQPVYELLQGPDDHTRLARIRAFLDGAGWYADRLPRIAPPEGAVLHWSRLPDLLPAGVIAASAPLIGDGAAAKTAVIASPLVLLAGLLAATFWAVRSWLPGQRAVAAPLLMVCLPTVLEFTPGSLDHHTWMMLAAMLGIGMVVRLAGDARDGVAAGVGGIGLGIGVAVTGETLIALAAVCAATGVLWLRRGSTVVAALRRFGTALALTGLVLLPVERPPGALLAAPCDRYGLTYAAILVAVAAIWWLAPLLVPASRARWPVRLAAGGATAAAVAVTLLVLFPHCRGGPMSGVPADQWATWLGHAAGMEPLWRKTPDMMALLGIAPLAGLTVAASAAWRDRSARTLWLALLTLTAVATIAMLTSTRSGNLANLAAVLPVAWLLTAALGACDRRWHGLRRAGAAVAVTLAVAASPVVVSTGLARTLGGTAADAPGCDTRGIRDALASLPPAHRTGVMAAPIFTGPYILTASDHAVLGAQYHRNVAGNRAATAILGAADAAAARRAVRRHGVTHIAVCTRTDPLAGPFGRALGQGDVPAWLTPVSARAAGPFRIFAVNDWDG